MLNMISGIGTWFFNNDDVNLPTEEIKSQAQVNKNRTSVNGRKHLCNQK